MKIQASQRLLATKANPELLRTYLEELGLYNYSRIQSSNGFVSVELDGEEWNTAKEALMSKFGRPANQAGLVMFSWHAGKGRTIVLDALSKPFTLALIDDN
jgi:hypothetical protein